MLKNPIGWFEIYVTDMERAKQFYQAVLGVTLEKLDDPNNSGMQMWAFPADMTQYGASGSLTKMDGMQSGGNSTVVYFSCEDCAVEESRVVAAGGKVQISKMSIGEHGFFSLAMDTEGNLVGLHSMQ